MKSYFISLSVFLGLMLSAMFVSNLLSAQDVPVYGFWGTIFLAGVSGFIHYFVYGSSTDPKKMIRRMMVGSTLRMVASIFFLAITLFSYRPLSIPFVISYVGSFFLLMLFDVYSIRCKLRPDLKNRSK